ncbi:pre-mRNA-splicing factor CWC25 homolog isoform X1 [Trifolium pratense]|uniref:pre-mRNA-splicing factor CWC25 homolog isoform X1 n=1 Tax=Trifolium pratense TaxID=57577 RepID=UPI001E6938A0|nr:pre-mRNA-splicing factor CWC25 homolog isoform X1 [Trifolium pratense]
MALKFLNKKGWHTGSLRNIENVWKAEQKHNAEEKKLDELRKQIQEERERSEFRLLQEKAGLVPHQERLEFLYDSGLSVGKTSEGFKALEALPKSDATDAPSSSASKQEASVPGALFEDKPQSANDSWRKLHSDPLLMIRQREQEALAKIKNNPVKMAMIRKSVEEKEHKKKDKKKKHRSSKSKHKEKSDSEDDIGERRKRKASDEDFDKKCHKAQSDSENESSDEERKRRKSHYDDKKYREGSPSHHQSHSKVKDYKEDVDNRRKNHYEDRKYRERSPRHHQSQSKVRDYKDADDRHDSKLKSGRHAPEGQSNFDVSKRGNRSFREPSSTRSSANSLERESHYKRRNMAPKLSEEERAAKLRQMQLAAELHEGERWKRIKKAEETDAQEAIQNTSSVGKNFLDTAQKSIYGAAEGGSASIAESIQRRTHYSQGRSGGEGNAFRR